MGFKSAMLFKQGSCVALPPLMGCLSERRLAGASASLCPRPTLLCKDICSARAKRLVALAAATVGVYSISLGLVQINLGDDASNLKMAFVLVGNSLLCLCLYFVLRCA